MASRFGCKKGCFALGGLALLVVASLVVLRGPPVSSWSLLSTPKDAHSADLREVSRLMASPPGRLLHLTDGRESSAEVLQDLGRFRDAMVVVTAGRSTLTRRAEGQPFISVAPASGAGAATVNAPLDPATATTTTSAVVPTANGATADDEAALAVLAAPLAAMNAAAAAVEKVLGRRLFPITLSMFDRTAGGQQPDAQAGPIAIFDASAGALLLDRGFVSYTWGQDRPEVSYITAQLAGRVLTHASELLGLRSSWRGAGAGAEAEAESGSGSWSGSGSGGSGGGSGQEDAGPQAGGSGSGAAEGGAAAAQGGVQAQEASTQTETEPRSNAEGARGKAEQQQQQQLPGVARRALLSLGGQEAVLPGGHSGGVNGGGAPGTAAADGGALPYLGAPASAAAAAVHLLGAAVGAALPAAFAAAPPLWFCVLCPTVLGLLAPVLINVALNQVAGALCTQMQLSDDQCFDVLLGALGVGFVLSLASAVPIFFVCRLPQCAGKNVTDALRRVAAWR